MEEENKRKEAQGESTATENAPGDDDAEMKDATPATEPADATPAASGPTVAEQAPPQMDDDEDDLLQQALALSMMEYNASNAEADAGQDDMEVDEDEDDDDELQKALQMSLADHSEPAADKTESTNEASTSATGVPDLSAIAGDQDLLASMIADLPGVDPNDPSIKSILDQMTGDKKKDEDKK
mmetsp:Transcript_19693/g.21909  ORF Transcript_19693/g.21909 Transcript_19693/m.21909 type:complete len:183 (+) Transcript_19693:138-686(+)